MPSPGWWPLPRPSTEPEAPSRRATFPVEHPLLGRDILLIRRSRLKESLCEGNAAVWALLWIDNCRQLILEEVRMESIGKIIFLIWGTFTRNLEYIGRNYLIYIYENELHFYFFECFEFKFSTILLKWERETCTLFWRGKKKSILAKMARYG